LAGTKPNWAVRMPMTQTTALLTASSTPSSMGCAPDGLRRITSNGRHRNLMWLLSCCCTFFRVRDQGGEARVSMQRF
jgi:hypothetical protein